jgi:surface antigen
MLEWGAAPSFRLDPYNGTPAASLWRAARRLIPVATALALALAGGGCSFSYKLGSLLGNEEKPDATSAISPAAQHDPAPQAASAAPDADLDHAKAAAREALARGRDDSVPWENPKTGARGTVTPLANAYTQDGFVCRDFLASYVRKGTESWLQGEACRIHQGRWEVRAMKPWKRP